MRFAPLASSSLLLLTHLACNPGAPLDPMVASDGQEEFITVEQGVASRGEKRVVRIGVSGASATASATTDLGQLGLQVHALRSSSDGTRAALTFARNWRDPSSYTCKTENVCDWPKDSPEPVCQDQEVCAHTRHSWENFAGEIPVGDFALAGEMARLVTDLSKATVQSYERCDADESVGTVECVNTGPTGTFELKWTKNFDVQKYESGTKEERRGKALQRTTGVTFTDSANVTGTGLGFTFSEPGEIQRVRGTSLQKEWILLR